MFGRWPIPAGTAWSYRVFRKSSIRRAAHVAGGLSALPGGLTDQWDRQYVRRDNDVLFVGRTPFREACNRLNREGLLDVLPRHGYLVPEISFRSVCDLFETRLILEMAIAELAAIRASDQDIEELNQLARRP